MVHSLNLDGWLMVSTLDYERGASLGAVIEGCEALGQPQPQWNRGHPTIRYDTRKHSRGGAEALGELHPSSVY